MTLNDCVKIQAEADLERETRERTFGNATEALIAARHASHKLHELIEQDDLCMLGGAELADHLGEMMTRINLIRQDAFTVLADEPIAF